MEMTKEFLKKHCKEQNQYGTPHLNDKLFLHFKGFQCIENLEEYTGLLALFLEGNAIDSLYGLETLVNLKCLFVQQNCISEIEEGTLDNNVEITNINLSNNNIREIKNLGALKNLHTLQMANNYLSDFDSITNLRECPSINVLDLSSNRLDGVPEDLDRFIELFQALPKLAVLYLQGNPVINKFRHYRKNLIARIPTLNYLDDRPVFEAERRTAEAWLRGGLEEEREERKRMAEEKQAAQDKQHEFMKNMIASKNKNKAMADKENRKDENGNSLGDDGDEDEEESEDEESEEEEEELEELVAARKRLAQYSARTGEQEPPELTAERKNASKQLPATWSPLVADETSEEKDIEIVNPEADDETRYQNLDDIDDEDIVKGSTVEVLSVEDVLSSKVVEEPVELKEIAQVQTQQNAEYQEAAAAFVQGLNDLD